MFTSGRLVRQVVFPVTAIISAGLLTGLTVLVGKDASIKDSNIPNHMTISTLAAAFSGVALVAVIVLTTLRLTNRKPLSSIFYLTGALLGIVEAILTINLIIIEKVNPLQFQLSSAGSVPIPTRIALWTVTNIVQLSFYLLIILLNRADRHATIPTTGLRRRRSSMPTDSQGSQSIPMLTEKSTRIPPPRPKTPPTPLRVASPPLPPSLPPVSISEKFNFNMPAPAKTLNPPVPMPASPSSPSKRNSWLQQVQQAVRPTNARRNVAGPGTMSTQHFPTQTARSSSSRDSQSIDSKSMTNSFDEYWDHPTPPEAQIKDILMLASPGSHIALRGASPSTSASGVIGTTLETIPGSRPVSPAKTLQELTASLSKSDTESSPALQSSASSFTTLATDTYHTRPGTSVSRRSITPLPGNPLSSTSRPPTSYSTSSTATITTGTNPRRYSSSRPTTPSSYNTLPSTHQYRPASPLPLPGEAHIHPLFRSDSPTPAPQITSPNTVVVASPFSGQVIGQISNSNQVLTSRPSLNLFRSPSSFSGVPRKTESSPSLRRTATNGRGSPSPSGVSMASKPSLASIAADMDDEISTSWATKLSQVPTNWTETSDSSSGRATPTAPAVPSRSVSKTSLSRTPSNGPIPQFVLDARRERLL